MVSIVLVKLIAAGMALRELAREQQMDSDSGSDGFTPIGAESWRSKIDPGNKPIDFLIKWIEIESDGNPCGVGTVAQLVRDGWAQEAGIGQTYFESSDHRPNGYTTAEIRSACDATSQRQLRPLTSEEVTRQIADFLGLVDRCMSSVNPWIAKSRATIAYGSSDYWKLVKLWHALPALVGLLPYASRRQSISSFSDFRAAVSGMTLAEVQLASQPAARYYADFDRLMSNADRTGGVL